MTAVLLIAVAMFVVLAAINPCSARPLAALEEIR